MNYKSRIRSIERKLNIGNKGIDFKRLIDPDFIYRGKAFDSIDIMYKKLNVVNIPKELTFKEISLLLEKRLISIVSLHAQNLIKETAKQCRANL